MNIKYISVYQVPDESKKLIDNKSDGMIINISEDNAVVCGEEASIREIVCRERNIMLFHAHYLGGSIVVFPGDLNIMEIKNGISNFGENAMKVVSRYLKNKGLIVDIVDNDLMIYNKSTKSAFKVGSYASNWIGELTENVIHISINMDLDLVKLICTKPMKKIPGSLSDYGITAEELLEVIKKEVIYSDSKIS